MATSATGPARAQTRSVGVEVEFVEHMAVDAAGLHDDAPGSRVAVTGSESAQSQSIDIRATPGRAISIYVSVAASSPDAKTIELTCEYAAEPGARCDETALTGVTVAAGTLTVSARPGAASIPLDAAADVEVTIAHY
jgi:hypothetical protein